MPQEPRQNTAKTQPYPRGDATVPQCADPQPGIKTGCIFQPFWDKPVALQPSGQGGTNWSPMPYSPDTGYFYVPGSIRTSVFERFPRQYRPGSIYTSGAQEAASHTPLAGTFTAIDSKTNQIAWQHKLPYRMGGGSGSSVTAGATFFTWLKRETPPSTSAVETCAPLARILMVSSICTASSRVGVNTSVRAPLGVGRTRFAARRWRMAARPWAIPASPLDA